MHVNFVLRKLKVVVLVIFAVPLFVIFTSDLNNSTTSERWMDLSGLQQDINREITKAYGERRNSDLIKKPVQNIVFLKTHKTASTTFMNILYRYGETRNLTFVFMKGDPDLGFPEHFRSRKVPRLVNGKQYNILCRHARFNKTSIQEVMPKDSVYITILREPISHLQSRFDFYNMAGFFRLESFLNPFGFFVDHLNDPTIKKILESDYVFRNPLLYELGMKSKDILNETLVNQTIHQLDKDFDFVILTEYFDESLILLKNLLNWNLTDLLYFKMWVHKNERHPLSPEQKQKIEDLNRMDLLLYKYFNQSFWKKLQMQNGKFWEEVETFRKMNRQTKEDCLNMSQSEPHRFDGTSRDVVYYHVRENAKDKALCNRMAADPWSYTSFLMRKQMRLLENQDLRWGFIPYDWRKLDMWDPKKGYRHHRKRKRIKEKITVEKDRILSILCGMNVKCKNEVLKMGS